MSSVSVNSESTHGADDVGDYATLNNEEQDQSIAKGGVTTP